MAKLSAYGQIEIWRLQHPESKIKYAAMNNGRLLKFTGSSWKVVRPLPQFADLAVLRAHLEAKGYVAINR